MSAQPAIGSVIVLAVLISVVSALTVAGLLVVWFRSRRKADRGGDE